MLLSIYALIFPFSIALGEEKHTGSQSKGIVNNHGSASGSLGTVKHKPQYTAARKRKCEEDNGSKASSQSQLIKKARLERSGPSNRLGTDTFLQPVRSAPNISHTPPSSPTRVFSNPTYDPTNKRHEWELQWFVCAHHAAFTASTAPCLRREILLRKKIARKHRALKKENAALRRELEKRSSAGATSY